MASIPHGPCLGLDFGTSNTALARLIDGRVEPVPLEGGAATLPSAVFYGAYDGSLAFGREAFARYLDGDEGRLLRGVKTVLGTSLMHERTAAGGRSVSFADIVGALFERVFRDLPDVRDGCTLVVGRPVRFGEAEASGRNDPEAFLVEVLDGLGFRDVSFLHEPIAASLTYAADATREELVLVVDVGGGTSDFAVVRIVPGAGVGSDSEVLASAGVRTGGDRFDERFSLASAMPHLGYGSRLEGSGREQPGRIWFELATWHRIHTLHDRRTADEARTMLLDSRSPELVRRLLSALEGRKGHAIAAAVEAAKIRLSTESRTSLALDVGAEIAHVRAERDDLDRAIARDVDRVRECALEAVQSAGVSPEAIDALCYTGGSSLVPSLRAAIGATFAHARAVDGNAFGSVAGGLAIEAGRRRASGAARSRG